MKQMKTLTEIVVPQLAESLVSATIDKWLKQPGDWIDIYEPVCEILTDKVNAELPSTVAGKMVKILVGKGETVPVGTAICLVETEGGANEEQPVQAGAVTAAQTTTGFPDSAQDAPMRGRFSPAVQQLAAEHSVRLTEVTGTGLGGRITRKDVLAYVASGAGKSNSAAGAATAAAQSAVDAAAQVRSSGLHLTETPRLPKIEVEGFAGAGRGDSFIDVTPIRNTIARNMRQSVSEIPHAWTMIEVDVTNLVLLRNKLKDEFMKREGINLTYLAFLLKAVVNAIKDFPIMNSMWAVDKIIVKRDINISLAVGTEDSVLTPVIKNADHKNVAGLAKEIDELARKTREGKLTLSDMQGGTFTVNNTGSFGSILSYPIINYPQAAILTFESIVKRPVVINDMLAVRSMANLCLSLDHRILDGVICGRFLQRVKDNLESFNQESKLY
ncbi:2-oxo acid dehydrogenase subunit E2 [Paenibacillus sp. N4]|uniref:dihydrolipoamide acetyltransferase family protein n=1 Tax=Paenibacillus vietnamensis TaxID=2590547 RepID=UPI001CD192E0|nr:dihydrolipoamide acetyltransferase family protein [Paenibacillus vietnamensis]MCA0754494.1 2-oxo acid dehydrogenase subunit E2 [Paenibacillus vietnamensis]